MEKFGGSKAVVKLLATILGFVLAAGSNLSAQIPHYQLSLRDVFERAETANLSILAGEAGLDATDAQTRQARSNLLPGLRLESSQVRQKLTTVGNPFFRAFPNTPGDPGAMPSLPSSIDTFGATLNATVPLVDPTDIARYKAAKLDTQAARFEQEARVQDVYAQIAQYYFVHVRNLSRLNVIENNISRDEVLLNLAQQRREAGVATDLDLTRASAALARDRQELLVAQTQVSQSRLTLLRLLDLEPMASISLDANEAKLPELTTLPELRSLLESRPEYQAAIQVLRRNRVAEKAAAWQRFPSVALQGQWGYVSETPFDGQEQEQWLLGVTLSMPLWEGGRISAEKDQAKALVRQQQYVIEQIERQVQTEYLLAAEAVSQRWEELPLARDSVRLSEQELKFAQTRFETGVADNRDVVEAQAALAAANDSYVDAVYRYQLARVDLARVLGDVKERLSR